MFNHLSWDELNSSSHKAKIAKRLHDERFAANLTLEDLAENTGYSKPTVQSWEKGWRKSSGHNTIPSLPQLFALMQQYDCSIEYLLCIDPEKTKPQTDISHEIGLTESSIKKLQQLFSYELEHPSDMYKLEPPSSYSPYQLSLDSSWRVDLFAFLNFFINNIESFSDLLSTRRPLALLQNSLDKMSADCKKELMNGFNQIKHLIGNSPDSLDDYLTILLRDQTLINYYSNLGYDLEKAEELSCLCTQYYSVLSTVYTKRSDFEISDTFMDIVKSFYSNLSENIESYRDFISHHIAPDTVVPVQIIKADKKD